MIRKMVVGTAAAALLATFVFGRDVCSYVRTLGSNVRDAVKSEIDLEFEVERARDMVEELMPEINDCMAIVAEQKVDVEALTRDIADREVALGRQQQDILSLRGDLDSGRERFVYRKISYTRGEVEHDLAIRFERFKKSDATLNRDRQILSARREMLQANQRKLENLYSEKQDLEVQVAQLEARLEQVQAAETVSKLEFDDSRLARAKELIRDLNKQLDVKEALLDSEGRFLGLIPVDSEGEAAEDVASEIDAYFGGVDEPALAELDSAA